MERYILFYFLMSLVLFVMFIASAEEEKDDGDETGMD